jgi:NitT/TauT family transport system substrate-binding protein
MLHRFLRSLYRKLSIHRSLQRPLQSVLLAILPLGLLVACNGTISQSPDNSGAGKPLIVGASIWPGFAAHYIAVEKNFFQEAGVTVQDQFFPSATDSNTALMADKIDLLWSGVPDMVFLAEKDPALRLILLSDYSNGADGILARGVSTPADLKQKPIAWEALPLQMLLLNKYLSQANLTQSDMQLLTMPAAEAATAFATQKVDAAITFEPWLTQATSTGQGEVIFSSANTNIIADGLITKTSVIQTHRPEIKAYLKAIDKASQFLQTNSQESLEILSRKLGLKPEEIPEVMATLRLFDLQQNKSVAFNPSDPMNVMDSLKFAAETGTALKFITKPVDPAQLYDDSIVNEL